MYFFTLYSLAGLHKGIQAGHSALEYVELYGQTQEYQDFIKNHKTFILLDGGGSQQMVERELELENFGIRYASFCEPDLSYGISAISFLISEDIYNFDEKAFLNYGYHVAIGEHMFFGHGAKESTAKAKEDLKKYELYKWLKSFRLASN